ncbi:MAG: transporter substrate-binding domain-containing protein [Oceanospirillaceae bacterium]|nr:transporter substrate-binding domain-containing protein [Oceanospirillaceae bacterium]
MRSQVLSGFYVMLICSQLANADSKLEKVRLATHNLCPYGCYQDKDTSASMPKLRFSGIAVDVVQCSLKKMSVQLEISVLPWKRAEKAASVGAVDGFFAASKNAVRDKFGTMSAIIAEQKWQWFLLNENPLDPQQLSFKHNATVSGFIGSNMLFWLKTNNYQVAATAIDTKILLKLLLRKRVDAVLANNYVMQGLLTEHNLVAKVKIYTLKNKPLAVYFGKSFLSKHPSFLTEFNANVNRCRS